MLAKTTSPASREGREVLRFFCCLHLQGHCSFRSTTGRPSSLSVTCGTILRNLKMAVKIKDLYGNPGYRFKKISIRRNSPIKNALPCLHGVFLLAMWLSRFDAILAISFIPEFPLKRASLKVLLNYSFHLNGHTLGFIHRLKG